METTEKISDVPQFVPDFDEMNKQLNDVLRSLKDQHEEMIRLRRCVIAYETGIAKQMKGIQSLIGEVLMLRDEIGEQNNDG